MLKGKGNSHAHRIALTVAAYYTWDSKFPEGRGRAIGRGTFLGLSEATIAMYSLQRAMGHRENAVGSYWSKTEYVRRSPPVFSIASVWRPGEKDRKSSSALAVTT